MDFLEESVDYKSDQSSCPVSETGQVTSTHSPYTFAYTERLRHVPPQLRQQQFPTNNYNVRYSC